LTPRHPSSRASYAAERARLLFGQYRRGDANDPDVYVASVAAILADYPAETIRYVTDPRTGIAANPINPNWSGLPDTAHVKRACENHSGPTRRAAEREAAMRRQIAERKALPTPSERAVRPSYEDLVRRCHDAGLMIGPHRYKTPGMKPSEIMLKYGISPEAWAAIPNQPQGARLAQSTGAPSPVNPATSGSESGGEDVSELERWVIE
jgi:hypothetical protein